MWARGIGGLTLGEAQPKASIITAAGAPSTVDFKVIVLRLVEYPAGNVNAAELDDE